MLIKGFIGFWGNKNENLISKEFCEKYSMSISNSVSFFTERYTVIVSREYVTYFKDGILKLVSGIECASGFGQLKIVTEITDESLLMQRDRWGSRMLYYIREKGNIYFSSDVRFLLELPINSINEYSEESLLECSTLGYIFDESRTIYKKIKQLPRNSRLTANNGLIAVNKNVVQINKDRYHSLDEAESVFTSIFERTLKNTNELIGNKAFLLSGGMDSTAIAIAASKNEVIHTISFASNNNTEDIYYANRIADYIKSDHSVVRFDNQEAVLNFPSFLNNIENVEMEGIFSPLGGYSYYLLCKKISSQGYEIVVPGEGADELLGGYYWPLTHSFGFVDKLKQRTADTHLYNIITSIFPDIEERNFYREAAYYFLQGSALTNYHLSCVEHTAKSLGLFNFPVFITKDLYEVVKDIPICWLCDGRITKIILRNYLSKHLEGIGLSSLITRKKLAMPSVVTQEFIDKLNRLAEKESIKSNNPYRKLLGENALNVMMLDVFHKYFTLQPLKNVSIDMWKEDLEIIEHGESIIHW